MLPSFHECIHVLKGSGSGSIKWTTKKVMDKESPTTKAVPRPLRCKRDNNVTEAVKESLKRSYQLKVVSSRVLLMNVLRETFIIRWIL